MPAPYADRIAVVDRGLALKGSVHRFLGLLARTEGDLEGAASHFEIALARHEAMQASALVDRTRRELNGVAEHVR
jgi:hypothetical protein